MDWLSSKIPKVTYHRLVREVLTEIQYHMLEPTIDGGQTWQLWTSNEVLNYMRERISKFLVETGLMIDRASMPMIAGTSSYNLASTLAELRRVGVDNRGLTTCDYWEQDHGTPGWQFLSGVPTGYLVSPLDQLTIQLDPIPIANGTINYHYIRSTPFEDPATSEQSIYDFVLRLPANFAWAIKYGVMADMFSKEGEANDPQRAEYCEQRWQEGIELAKLLIWKETENA